MTPANFIEFVIVGAGPAGVSLSRRLTALGVDHLVLERGRAGETWRRVPPTLMLLSPWWTNALSVAGILSMLPTTKATAREFTAHLLDQAATQSDRIRSGVEVVGIARDADGFTLSLGDGSSLQCLGVACCTGYFSNPAPPSPEVKSDGSILSMHASAISDYTQLDDLKTSGFRALVIGRRVTGGQLAMELHSRGFRVAISAKEEIQFRRAGMLGELKDALYFPFESLRLAIKPRTYANSFPVMDGGRIRSLIGSGDIDVRPRALAIADGQVEFAGAPREKFDLVIHATGYAPSLDYLQLMPGLTWRDGAPTSLDFQVDGYPGLFLLGLDNLYNFTSRYLRGIRRDSKTLAKLIKAHVCAVGVNGGSNDK